MTSSAANGSCRAAPALAVAAPIHIGRTAEFATSGRGRRWCWCSTLHGRCIRLRCRLSNRRDGLVGGLAERRSMTKPDGLAPNNRSRWAQQRRARADTKQNRHGAHLAGPTFFILVCFLFFSLCVLGTVRCAGGGPVWSTRESRATLQPLPSCCRLLPLLACYLACACGWRLGRGADKLQTDKLWRETCIRISILQTWHSH